MWWQYLARSWGCRLLLKRWRCFTYLARHFWYEDFYLLKMPSTFLNKATDEWLVKHFEFRTKLWLLHWTTLMSNMEVVIYVGSHDSSIYYSCIKVNLLISNGYLMIISLVLSLASIYIHIYILFWLYLTRTQVSKSCVLLLPLLLNWDCELRFASIHVIRQVDRWNEQRENGTFPGPL